MAFYYFDTDSIFKLLLPEVGHSTCIAIYGDPNNTIILSNFTIIEVHSALSISRNRQEISERLYKDAIKHFNSILVTEVEDKATICIVEVISEHLKTAKDLVNDTNLRPGDSLQVSVALTYKELDLTVVSGDKKVLRICEKHGLNILNINKCYCSTCGQELIFIKSIEKCDQCGTVINEVINEAKCLQCGGICQYCKNPKWCDKIRKAIAI